METKISFDEIKFLTFEDFPNAAAVDSVYINERYCVKTAWDEIVNAFPDSWVCVINPLTEKRVHLDLDVLTVLTVDKDYETIHDTAVTLFRNGYAVSVRATNPDIDNRPEMFKITSYSFTKEGLRNAVQKIRKECKLHSVMLSEATVFESYQCPMFEGNCVFTATIEVEGKDSCRDAVAMLSTVGAPFFLDIEVYRLNRNFNFYEPYRVFNCDRRNGALCTSEVVEYKYMPVDRF